MAAGAGTAGVSTAAGTSRQLPTGIQRIGQGVVSGMVECKRTSVVADVYRVQGLRGLPVQSTGMVPYRPPTC